MTTARTTGEAAFGGPLVRLLQLLRRRKLWIVVPPLVLVALAVAHSSSQSTLYRGEANVLLSRVNLQSLLNNQTVVGISGDQVFRIQKTQASLARSPVVAERTLDAANVTDITPEELLDRTTVEPDRAEDLLHFQVEDADKDRAQQLSEEFARQYVVYRQELDTAAIRTATRQIRRTLAGLDATDPDTSRLRASLRATDQELMTLKTLQSGNATYVRDDSHASKVRPTPVRDGVLAALLGLVIGVGLAFLREALDTRVRTAEEAGAILGLPFLGYLSPPPKRSRLRMLENPYSPTAEAFRKLALNVQFANLGRPGSGVKGYRAHTIMVSSAVPEEGKSTTIADLALTLARSSRRVALVDFDLRKPTLHTLFELEKGRGVTHVALGANSLSEVGQPIDLRLGENNDGELVVFQAGTLPPNPGEFLESNEVADLIAELKAEYDYVLFDSPPILVVGDPLTLSRQVDGIFLVVRIGSTTRAVLREVRRLMEVSGASALGFAVTGSDRWLKAYGVKPYTYGNAEVLAGDGSAAADPAPERVRSE